MEVIIWRTGEVIWRTGVIIWRTGIIIWGTWVIIWKTGVIILRRDVYLVVLSEKFEKLLAVLSVPCLGQNANLRWKDISQTYV